jgi:putative iron-dependent peroxidase
MPSPQPAVLAPVAGAGRYLTMSLRPGADARALVHALSTIAIDPSLVVGLGAPLVTALEADVPGLHAFRAVSGQGVSFPSTQGALWVALRGDDGAALVLRARAIVEALSRWLVVDEDVAGFRYREGRDLSGYVDGTENPEERAAEVALSTIEGIAGSSFVCVQRWVHDLARIAALAPDARDHVIGRRLEDDEELDDAPETAHVKRTAQEDFEPPAFMLRRSMPYGSTSEQGLYFVAYAASLDAFERALARMAGLDDGLVDALTTVSRAVTGAAYWCPAVNDDGTLELGAIRA